MNKTRRYYFYATTNTPNWYTMTTDTLRESITKNREDGKWITAFPIMFVFTGKCTDAADKDEAEKNFRDRTNLSDCKEPACMLRARREFFEQHFLRV